MIKLSDWAEHVQVYESTPKPIRLLVYGEAGSGKTQFSLTADNGFFIDTDRGLLTAVKMGVTPRFIALSKEDQVYRIVKSILIGVRDSTGQFADNPPNVLVIDSVSFLAEAILWECMLHPIGKMTAKDPTNDKAEFDHWGILQNRMKELLDITKDLPCHVIATAGVKMEEDGIRGGWIIQPNLVGGIRNSIGHYFDEMFYMEPKGSGDRVKYVTYTARHGNAAAKSRTGRPAEIENLTFPKLLEVEK